MRYICICQSYVFLCVFYYIASISSIPYLKAYIIFCQRYTDVRLYLLNRPSDLACAIAHAHHNSREGEVRGVKYSAPHVVRSKKNIVCFRFLTDPIKTYAIKAYFI